MEAWRVWKKKTFQCYARYKKAIIHVWATQNTDLNVCTCEGTAPQKAALLIALCAKVRGTSVFAFACEEEGKKAKNKHTPHPSALFVPCVRREHRNTIEQARSSKPRCKIVRGRARPRERERDCVGNYWWQWFKGVKELFRCLAMRVCMSEALFTATTQHYGKKKIPLYTVFVSWWRNTTNTHAPKEVLQVRKEQQLLCNNHPARGASSAKDRFAPDEIDLIRNWVTLSYCKCDLVKVAYWISVRQPKSLWVSRLPLRTRQLPLHFHL